MRRSAETFLKICEALEKSPVIKHACEAVGISERVLYQWLSRSQAGQPDMVFDYIDPATPFHVAVKHAQQMFYQKLAHTSEHRALYGHDAQTFFRGRPMYRLREEYMFLSDEQLADFQRVGVDVFERDEAGRLLPVLEKIAPPVQLQLGILAGRLPKVYGTKITHDVNQKVALGVHVVKQKLPPPVEIVTPSLPAPEDVEDGDFTEPDDDLDFLGLPIADEAIKPVVEALATEIVAQVVEPEPEQMASQPEPGNPNIDRSPTPMRAQLEALLREQQARAAKAPPSMVRPAPPTFRGSSSDPAEGVGPGVIPPGAIKIK